MSLERALELAERGRGTTFPNPVVGAVLVNDSAVVGEGWHQRPGEAHAEVIALRGAGDRARAATLYVTLEPCSHHGRTPPCADALIDAGVARVVVGVVDPNPEVSGAGIARLREAGIEVDVADGELARQARRQLAGYLSVHERGRPWVIYKAAITFAGRMTLPGEQWISGEESRRLVHELRGWVDAVAVGMGTVRADNPQLDARGVDAPKQPRRLAFGRGPLPAGSTLELRSGAIDDELNALAHDGVQTFLLEGGPTLATSFLAADLVDQVMVFVAPKLGGEGAGLVAALPNPVRLQQLRARTVGDDVLREAFVHDP